MMGQLSSSQALSSKQKIKIFMHGFHGSGKQSILEAFKAEGSSFSRYKKTAFNNISLLSWDLGGRGYSRVWASAVYRLRVDAMVIVVNCIDDYDTSQIADLFKECLQEELLKDTIFLVLANKQDVEGARSVEHVAKELDFYELTGSHVANIMGCSAKTGEGLQEAMDWLVASLDSKEELVPVEKPEVKSRSMISCVKGGFHALKSMVKRS